MAGVCGGGGDDDGGGGGPWPLPGGLYVALWRLFFFAGDERTAKVTDKHNKVYCGRWAVKNTSYDVITVFTS